MEKRKITIITISVLSFILVSFLLAANKMEMEKHPESFTKQAECECDSIKSLLIDAGIENYRYEIILDSLWKKNPELYNEVTKYLE
jgi:hypothetical protein